MPIFGLPLYVFSHGDLSQPASPADLHHHHLRPANTTENLVGLPAETETDALPLRRLQPGRGQRPRLPGRSTR